MKIAVVSDIHSNLEAFEAVLKDIDTISPDEVVSLGDNVGYGADPESVLSIVQQRGISSVSGNHELACIDLKHVATFNYFAKKALHVNKSMLSEESLRFVSRLNPYLVRWGCRFVHGMPPDSQTMYITYEPDDEIARAMESIPEMISFVGHTHFLRLYQFSSGGMKKKALDEKCIALDKNSRYIINTGSVGQPRDGDVSAKYVILDTERYEIEPRYVPYDNKKAAEKIIQAGIPAVYSDLIRG